MSNGLRRHQWGTSPPAQPQPVKVFTHFLITPCFLPTGCQAQPGRCPHASSTPRAVPQQPKKATGTRTLDTAPASSGQHKPRTAPGPPAARPLCAAFYGKWENSQKHPNISQATHHTAWQHAYSLRYCARMWFLQTWLLLRAYQQQCQAAFHCKDKKNSKTIVKAQCLLHTKKVLWYQKSNLSML